MAVPGAHPEPQLEQKVVVQHPQGCQDPGAPESLAQFQTRATPVDPFYQLLNALPDQLVLYDRQRHILFVNEAGIALAGRPLAEWLGRRDEDLFAPQITAQYLPALEATLNTGRPHQAEYTLTVPDGNLHSFWVRYLPLMEDDGQVAYVLGTSLDITHVRLAEAALALSEHNYRALVQTVNAIIIKWDVEGRIQFLNDYGLELLGYTAEELIGRSVIGTIVPEQESTGRDLKSLMAGICRSPQDFAYNENENLCRTGERVWIAWSNRPIVNEQGQLVAVFSVGTNITPQKQAEAELRVSEARFRALFEQAAVGIVQADLTGAYQRVNAAFCQFCGYSEAELLGMRFQDLTIEEDLAVSVALGNQLLTGEVPAITLEKRFRHKQGQIKWASTTVSLVRHGDGTPAYTIAVITDLTERKQMEETLQRQKELFQTIFDHLPVMVSFHDPAGRIAEVNRSLVETLGWPRQHYTEGEGLVTSFPAPEDYQELLDHIQQADGTWKDVQVFTDDGRCLDTTWAQIRLSDGSSIGIAQDITQRRRTEAKLLHTALHDSLTGLPNRFYFTERLDQVIRQQEHYPDDLFAVLFLDIDRFKTINDSLGHTVGDELLINFSHRLLENLGARDTLARLGGDEFAILLETIHRPEDAEAAAGRLLQILAQPVMLANGQEVHTTVSIGLVYSDRQYREGMEMIRDADIAMYQAKRQGRSRVQVFRPQMHHQAVATLQLETELRQALKQHQFQVYYQSIVDMASQQVVGYEALIRWPHPRLGLLTPDRFLPLAQDVGLMAQIDGCMLQTVCRQLMTWQQTHPAGRPPYVSVNVSNQQFLQPDLTEWVAAVLAHTGLAPGCLQLEITESVIAENDEAAARVLADLRDLGVQLAIDDFGTGYSSLSRLRQFPITSLKIDKSFIQHVASDVESQEIVRVILSLAQLLGMSVVAEGLETQRQSELLLEWGCRYGQGILYGRPAPADQIY